MGSDGDNAPGRVSLRAPVCHCSSQVSPPLLHAMSPSFAHFPLSLSPTHLSLLPRLLTKMSLLSFSPSALRTRGLGFSEVEGFEMDPTLIMTLIRVVGYYLYQGEIRLFFHI